MTTVTEDAYEYEVYEASLRCERRTRCSDEGIGSERLYGLVACGPGLLRPSLHRGSSRCSRGGSPPPLRRLLAQSRRALQDVRVDGREDVYEYEVYEVTRSLWVLSKTLGRCG